MNRDFEHVSNLSIRIRQKDEGEFKFLLEFSVLLDRVLTYSDYFYRWLQ